MIFHSMTLPLNIMTAINDAAANGVTHCGVPESAIDNATASELRKLGYKVTNHPVWKGLVLIEW